MEITSLLLISVHLKSIPVGLAARIVIKTKQAIQWLCLCFLIICFTKVECNQQIDDLYHLRTYTTENVLTGSVKESFLDDSGYMWFVSEYQIMQYDGITSKIYDANSHPQYFKHRINAVFENVKEDGLVVNDEDGNITFSINDGRVNPIPDFESNKGRYLFGSLGYMNNPKVSGPSITAKTHQTIFDSIDIYSIYHDFLPMDSSCYYVFHQGEMQYYNGFKRLHTESVQKIPHRDLNTFYFRMSHTLYYLQADGCEILAFQKGIKIGAFPWEDLFKPNQAPGCTLPKETRIVYSNYYHYPILIAENKVFYFDIVSGKPQFTLLFSDFNTSDISSVFISKSKDEILITKSEEVVHLTKKIAKSTYNTDFTSKQIYYATQAIDDRFAVTGNGQIIDLNHDQIIKKPGLDFMTEFIYKTGNNEFVTYEIDGNLLYLNDELNIQKIVPVPVMPTALIQDHYNRLWLGSAEGIGFIDTLGVYQQKLNFAENNGLYFIECMAQSPARNIWIGCRDRLLELNPITFDVKENEDLSGVEIRSIYFSADSSAWITSYGEGIFHVKNGITTKIPIDQHKYLNFAHCIIEDELGYFWISTNNGLFKISKAHLKGIINSKINDESLTYQYFDQSSGFASNEFNGGCQPCGILLRNGHLIFPSMKGLVKIQTKNSYTKTVAKNFLVDFTIDGQDFNPQLSDISIPHSQSKIDLSVMYPRFKPFNNYHLQYKLHGYDSEWQKLGTDQGNVTYTNLDPGSYSFEVVNKNSLSKSEVDRYSLPFIIHKNWYQTLVFKILVLSVLSFLLYVLHQFRLKSIRNANEKLEQRVFQRTEDLNNMLLTKDKMMRIISHDILGNLRVVLMLSNNKSRMTTDRHYTNQNLNDLSYSLSQIVGMTEKLLFWSKLQDQDLMIKSEEVDLHRIVQDVIDYFKPRTIDSNCLINNHVKDTILVTDRMGLRTLLNNLVDNDLKHNGSRQIKISNRFDKENDQMCIEILFENGDAEKIKKANRIFKKLSDYDLNRRYLDKGLGLTIISELTQKMNIRLGFDLVSDNCYRIILHFLNDSNRMDQSKS